MSGPGGQDLPDWADSRLVVRVDGSSVDPDELFVIAGNPHTFRGFVRVFSLKQRTGMSVRPRNIVSSSEFVKGWLLGYLDGAEPRPVGEGAFEHVQAERQLSYFHTYQLELRPDRRGAFSINAVRHATSVAVAYERIASSIASLTAVGLLPTGIRWQMLDSGAPEMVMETAADVEDAFLLLNAGYAVGADSEVTAEVCVQGVGGDPGVEGIEMILSVDASTERVNLVFNLESLMSLGADPVEVAAASLLNSLVDGFDPDSASVSGGLASWTAGRAGIWCDDELVVVEPGQRVYLSDRLGPVCLDDIDRERFDVTPVPGGTTIEFSSGWDEIRESDVERLRLALDQTYD